MQHYPIRKPSWTLIVAAFVALTASETLRAGEYDKARQRVTATFREMPLLSNIWWQNYGFRGLNLGAPITYNGHRMIVQIVSIPHQRQPEPLQMTVVIAPSAVVRRPTLPLLRPETVTVNLAPEVLADEAAIVHQSARLFCRWVEAITGGYAVELLFHVLEEGTTTNFTDDGTYIYSYPNYAGMLDAVPRSIANRTDFWLVISPSGVPGDGSGFNREFITGGMGQDGSGRPIFIADDAWIIRKPAHLGRGNYTDVERRTYLPQWFQHEFMHHLYRVWRYLDLEPTPHSWSYRLSWPLDFVGNTEADYFAESIEKRLLAANPPLIEGLRAFNPADLSGVPLAALAGDFRHNPVEYPYHEVSVTLEDGVLRWNSGDGRSVVLEIRNGTPWAIDDVLFGDFPLQASINRAGTQVQSFLRQGERFDRVSP